MGRVRTTLALSMPMNSADSGQVRLLTVCGSLQQHSLNRTALDVASARAAGTIIDDYEALADIPAFNVDLVDAPGPVVEGWRRRVRLADAVLLAAPEYAGGVAGALKNALDWLVSSGELYRKPVAVLTAATSGGLEARRMTVQTLPGKALTWSVSSASPHPAPSSTRREG
jgi:chromate reductase, NAD(P)H dehydrogenase (quinone)